jgi:hypothetical protein
MHNRHASPQTDTPHKDTDTPHHDSHETLDHNGTKLTNAIHSNVCCRVFRAALARSRFVCFVVRCFVAQASSGLPIPQQILDRVGDLGDLSVEQMIGRVNHDELFRLRGTGVERAHVLQETDFVELALDENFGLVLRSTALKS